MKKLGPNTAVIHNIQLLFKFGGKIPEDPYFSIIYDIS